ncbi:uncharacterized protein PEZ65_006746 [Lycodopsis pacificus]
MSVTFSSKSGEVGEDSLNLMTSDNRPKYGWRSHSSVWWIGAAAVCLGFLLLILILGVVAHNSRAIGDRQDSMCENLIYSLTIDRDTLRDERDQLKINSGNLTKEMEVLQSQYNAMAESRDKLQEEVNRLNLSRTEMEVLQSQYNAMAESRDKLQEEVNRLNLSRTVLMTKLYK